MTRKPWKHQPNARTCRECGTQVPGMQPLTLVIDGKPQRGYWHLKCFEIARSKLREKKA